MAAEMGIGAGSSALGLLGASGAAFLIAYLISRRAARGGWLPDVPNMRSSHEAPASRAGGVAIMAAFAIACIGLVGVAGWKPSAGAVPAFGVCALAFALGLADDRNGLRPLVKLGGQVICAAALVTALGPVTAFPVPGLGAVGLGALAPALTVFGVVAFMNAFNFMDGANGLAAGAAVIILSGLASALAGDAFFAAAALALAGSLAGFFIVNTRSGRVFMGDSGSHGVALALVALALAGTVRGGDLSPLFLPTAAAPLVTDVAFTLAHRALRRRNVLAAHREHVYQLLLRRGHSHGSVAALYIVLTLISTAVALITSTASAGWAWAAALGIAAALTGPAIWIFRDASRRGAFAEPDTKADPAAAVDAASESASDAPRAVAAE